ncbi:MAG: ubiquitin-like domain-containing protein [Anaerolineales bacterium]
MQWSRRLRPWLPAIPPLLALAGLALMGWATAPSIKVVVEGRAIEVRTHAHTVQLALRHAGIQVAAEDRVEPAMDQPVRGDSLVTIRRAHQVLLQVDGSSRWFKTPERNPANALAEAGYRLLPGDRVWVDGLPFSQGGPELATVPQRIRLQRGTRVDLVQLDQVDSLRFGAATLAQGLTQHGLRLFEGDHISPGWTSAPADDQQIDLVVSRPVRIEVDGKEMSVRTVGKTVREVLGQNGIALIGLDRAEPGLEERTPRAGVIRVHRIREEVMVELEPVPFESTYQPLAGAEIDTKRIIETGSYGVRANQVRVRYEDGQEVGRIVEGEWLAREPSPRLVGYGTKIVVRTAATDDGTIEYWRSVQMWATSYSASRAGVSPDAPNYGITASGKPLTKGLVAIDRSLIPFGTRMYVPGYGFAEAADTGGGVRGRWIDLGYDDGNYRGWAQYVTVYFLTPVPPANNIVWIFP